MPRRHTFMTRFFRRYDTLKVKQKRQRYWSASRGTKRQVACSLATPKRCACLYCQNPRRAFGRVTRQEKKLSFAEIEY